MSRRGRKSSSPRRPAWSLPARSPNGQRGPGCVSTRADRPSCPARYRRCTSRSNRTTPSISSPIYGCIIACRREDNMPIDKITGAPLAPYRVSAYNTAHDSYRKIAQRAERPPADEASLAVGTWLGLDPYPITPELAAQHRADLRENLPLYAEEGLIHPAMILRACNFVINRNVSLGPWIHVSSRIQHLAAARIGTTLSARGRVTANYEHKGHRFVDVDVLVLAEETPIAQVAHLAIYRPRQVIAA